jgi:hypothetical protein
MSLEDIRISIFAMASEKANRRRNGGWHANVLPVDCIGA